MTAVVKEAVPEKHVNNWERSEQYEYEKDTTGIHRRDDMLRAAAGASCFS
jgi:hypothetical protein